MAKYPRANLDECARKTPLNDGDCGAAITAADKIAADTVRRLRQQAPEHADLLYGPALLTAGAFRGSLSTLRDSIPCYGLSEAPQPPPPLAADAQSICAEAADIAKVKWRIFLAQVGVQPTDTPSGT